MATIKFNEGQVVNINNETVKQYLAMREEIAKAQQFKNPDYDPNAGFSLTNHEVLSSVEHGKKNGYYMDFNNGAANLYTPTKKAILIPVSEEHADDTGDVCSIQVFICEISNIEA